MEVVSPATLLRRKEEAEWQRISRARGYDLYAEHALLALAQGDIVTAARYTGDLWWFVRDVNGVERTITAATVMFDQAVERTFPFEMVESYRLWPTQVNEKTAWIERLEQELPQSPRCAKRTRRGRAA
ncbi:MAG TPA: hypothetical protein VGM91_05625 [Conexibacter sp.]|jgi:hypothetical protein